MAASLTFYEFFAGGGMARIGLGNRWTCTFANDFDATKAAAYRANFADAAQHFHEGDVWALSSGQLPGHADPEPLQKPGRRLARGAAKPPAQLFGADVADLGEVTRGQLAAAAEVLESFGKKAG